MPLTNAFAQRKVDPHLSYHRIICIVPYIGKGTISDPKRPLYAPIAGNADRSGILGWIHVPSDDKTVAIVEFVAADPAAFKAILADKSVKSFVVGGDARGSFEPLLKLLRADIDLNTFHAVVH